MIKLDISILDELGLGDLPEEEKKKLFETFVETLELNVGTVLSTQMTEDQLGDFMKLIDSGQQEQAKQWLETNTPNYKQVVADELDKLKAELKLNAQVIRDSLEQ
jgi:hypothetical protein